MRPIQHSHVAGQVIGILRHEIREGLLPEVLPSCRDLAGRFGVSTPTVLTALKQLAADGWLVPGKPKRPYRLAVPSARKPVLERRLLILSSEGIGLHSGYTQAAVKQLVLECTSEDWEVRTQILAYTNASRPGRRWDLLIGKFRPTHVVAITGTPVLARWLDKHRVPSLFIGGSCGDSNVTVVGVSLSACVRTLLQDWLERGHFYFCLPVCGYPDAFVEAMHRVCREELERRGMAFVPSYHAPSRQHGGGGEIRSVLKQVFATRMPSALIFMKLNDYLGALGLLQSHRLVDSHGFPLAILTHEDAIDWMDPRPAHFVYPYARLWRHLKGWLHSAPGSRFHQSNVRMPAKMVAETRR
jgi:hypothetical protein